MMFTELRRWGAVNYIEQQRARSTLWGFSHVPKTAGSSLVASLAELRAPYYNILVKDYKVTDGAFREQEWAETREFVRRQKTSIPNDAFRTFSGHMRRAHVDFIRGELPDTRFFTLLRNPVDRVVSDYRYCLTPAYPACDQFLSRFPSIRDFARHPISQNIMVKYLARDWRASPAAVVESVLNGFEFIGIMELYDVSVSMIFRLLGIQQRPLLHLNRTVDTDHNSFELDERLFDDLRQINELDETLYWTVRNMLDKERSGWADNASFDI